MATSCANVPVKFQPAPQNSQDNPRHVAVDPGTILLKQGTQIKPDALPLPCHILKYQDVAVSLRDGTMLYIDILVPDGVKYKLPTILSYTPFGKDGGFARKAVDASPFRNGIPQRTVSGLEVFEGVDPAYWCNFG